MTQSEGRKRGRRRKAEDEVTEIPKDATPGGGQGSEIASLCAKTRLRSEIPELRGHPIKPLEFEP